MLHLEFSPIKGPEGNIEYLLHLKKEKEPEEEIRILTEREAEERLRQIQEEKTGLSHTKEWAERISELVLHSHEEL